MTGGFGLEGLTFEAAIGGGYRAASRYDLDGVELWDNDPRTASVIASYKITFGKITFIPEILWENLGEDENGVNQGNAILFGLYVVMDF